MSERPILRALVTGATSGIGRATAIQLGLERYDVIVHGRNAERGQATVDAIVQAGGQARFIAAELSDPKELARLVELAGDVDVLVNNSGVAWIGPTNDLPVERFDALFAANVRAPYYLVAAIGPKMLARKRGSIINVSSVVGVVGLPGAAAYSATKASLDAMTRSWAVELAPYVRVNSVAPGPVYTSISRRERVAALGDTTLMKRAGEAVEIAEMIAFLASPRAAYITGGVFPVDGGRSAI